MNTNTKLRAAILHYETGKRDIKAAEDALATAKKEAQKASDELIRVIKSLGLEGKAIIVGDRRYLYDAGYPGYPGGLSVNDFDGLILKSE
jgi:hypothetical protein